MCAVNFTCSTDYVLPSHLLNIRNTIHELVTLHNFTRDEANGPNLKTPNLVFNMELLLNGVSFTEQTVWTILNYLVYINKWTPSHVND